MQVADLRDGEDTGSIVECKLHGRSQSRSLCCRRSDVAYIFERHVRSVTVPATTSVWRITSVDTSPSLNVSTIPHVRDRDVACSQVFDSLKAVVVLPNAADCHSQPCKERTVFYQDVRTVGLERDGVVTTVNVESSKGDVVGVDGVCTICLPRISARTPAVSRPVLVI